MKQHKIRKNRYNDLGSLKREIEESKVENVKLFDGYKIVTNKNTYRMFDSTIIVNQNDV
jgi:hypothetical protein